MHAMRGRKLTFLTGVAVGAGLSYFFDPDRGKARRNKAVDQAGGKVRRARSRADRAARAAGAETYGAWQKATHRTPAEPEPDDRTLAHKVESELFGDPSVPKGSINVDAVGGVVVLRGQARTPEEIKDLERRVAGIAGVEGVQNLLHLPKTPAPNKLDAREAG